MSRRIRVRIERLVVDAGSGVDRHALADALRRQLGAQLRAPGAAAAVQPGQTRALDAGESAADAGAVARRIASRLPGGGRS